MVVATAGLPPTFEQIPHRVYPIASVEVRVAMTAATWSASSKYVQTSLAVGTKT
jgi:hypothetical protein